MKELSTLEAKVFEVLLSAGPVTAREVATALNIRKPQDRAAFYGTFEALVEAGLAELAVSQGGFPRFRATRVPESKSTKQGERP